MFLQRLILLLIICVLEGICTSMHTGVHSILKRVAHYLDLDWEVFVRCLCGSCEPNLVLLQEQDTLLTTGPSLRPSMFPYSKKYFHNLKRIIMISNKKYIILFPHFLLAQFTHSFNDWVLPEHRVKQNTMISGELLLSLRKDETWYIRKINMKRMQYSLR